MPDAKGNFKGISVPELPWQKASQRFRHGWQGTPTEQVVASYRYAVDENGIEQVSVKKAHKARSSTEQP